MTTKPRRPLGEKDTIVEVPEKLVAVRVQTLALAAFTEVTGTLPTEILGLEPVSGNTTFEEITCVGLTPSLDQLTATVRINANTGYSGSLCAAGSTEHVRFYVSTDDGATWSDAGADAFPVHDTPGPRPLVHAANVVAPMRHTLCWIENHPLVRAILSWNIAPPAGQPDWVPPWGNVVDVRVRPRSRRFPKLWELVEIGAVKLPEIAATVLDLDSELTAELQPAPAPADLAEAYRSNDVQPSRFVFPHYLKATAAGSPALARAVPPRRGGRIVATDAAKAEEAQLAFAQYTGTASLGSVLDGIGIKVSDFLEELLKTDGDTSYEELGCVGYDPVQDALVGVFTVKRPFGYSGSACTTGSTEYVAFWVDWGSGWEYVGTTSTVVHDEAVPPGGLRFSVYHPLGSYPRRRACSDGPVQPRVRAVLSWEQAPPPGDPGWVPTWGNREEARFELSAGAVTPLAPVLESVSGYAVCQVDQASGLTHVHERPFGGGIGIAGFIPGAPDLAAAPMKYRLTARRLASDGTVLSTEELVSPFSVWVTESIGGAPPVQYSVLQEVDSDGWFTYRADPSPSGAGWRQVVGNLLYPWSSGPRTGLWEIELRAKDHLGTEYAAQVITCPDSSLRQRVRLYLDQAAPTVDVAITGYHLPGQPSIPAGSCMKFPVGAVIEGTFEATDEHFDAVSLSVEGAPYTATTLGGTPRWSVTGATAYPAAPTTGTSGTWEFDTAGMQACGYVLRGVAHDRTVNGGGGWWEDDVEGFSLE